MIQDAFHTVMVSDTVFCAFLLKKCTEEFPYELEISSA